MLFVTRTDSDSGLCPTLPWLANPSTWVWLSSLLLPEQLMVTELWHLMYFIYILLHKYYLLDGILMSLVVFGTMWDVFVVCAVCLPSVEQSRLKSFYSAVSL